MSVENGRYVISKFVHGIHKEKQQLIICTCVDETEFIKVEKNNNKSISPKIGDSVAEKSSMSLPTIYDDLQNEPFYQHQILSHLLV